MIILVTLDDNNGMMFNHRRQSQDEVLRSRILEIARIKKLRMNSYSAKQFSASDLDTITISETFLQDAQPGDFCFVEDCALSEYVEKIEQLIVFRWNRVYPRDMKLDIPLNTWKQISSTDFSGKSHEKITEEVYIR